MLTWICGPKVQHNLKSKNVTALESSLLYAYELRVFATCPALRGSTVSHAGVAHAPKNCLEYSMNFWSQSKKKNLESKTITFQWIPNHKKESMAAMAQKHEEMVNLLAKMVTNLQVLDYDQEGPLDIAMCRGLMPTMAKKWML